MEEKVLASQMGILTKNLLFIVPGNVLMVSLMAYIFWDIIERQYLLIWLTNGYLIALYGLIMYRYYPRVVNYDKYKYIYLLHVLLSGLNWGALSFSNVSVENYYIIMLVLAGITTNGIGSYASYLPACHLTTVPIIGPIILNTYFQDSEVGVYLSVMSLAYLFTLLGYSIVNNKSAVESIKLGFENLDLIDRLRKKNDEVEKANLAKSKFLAAASHDLRQPLHAMTLFIGSLKQSESEAERNKLYEFIQKSQDSLMKLFDALIDISKLDAATIDINKKPVMLSKAIESILIDYEMEAKKKGISLRFRKSDVVVLTDVVWFRRIVQNLISNAIKYTEKGGVLIGVRVHNNTALLQIWDTGCGIDVKDQEVIFEEFRQLHNEERNRELGLGLGLSIVKRLAVLLQHKLTLSSVAGKGSVFSVELAVSEKTCVEESVNYSINVVNKLTDKKVLVVDDEKDIRIAMKGLLHKWGCNVTGLESLEDVVKSIEIDNYIPDLLITDYRLGHNKTGLDVINELYERLKINIPSVVITGETSAVQIQKLKESGHRVIQKPINPAKLRVVLNNLAS